MQDIGLQEKCGLQNPPCGGGGGKPYPASGLYRSQQLSNHCQQISRKYWDDRSYYQAEPFFLSVNILSSFMRDK